MPTYSYRCAYCGVFELRQRLTAPPLGACPACGLSVHRVVTGGIEFCSRHPHIDGGYCSQLARCKNDPEAHYSGIDSFRRLVDKRQRQGYRVLKPGEDLGGTAARDVKREKSREKRERLAENAVRKALED